MRRIIWNDGWRFGKLSESVRRDVTLPHDAAIFESRMAESVGGVNTGWFEGFDYCYEKSFTVPQAYDKQRVFIEFEGVYHRAEVFINDEKAASRPNGYVGFWLDATDLLRGGENHIKVIARNADQPNSRWYSGAGLYRGVNLYILPEKHINLYGVKVRTADYANRRVCVAVETNGSGEFSVEILDGGDVLQSATVTINGNAEIILDVPQAKLWGVDNPNLYKCRATFGEDEQTVTFGIRQIECDPKKGFFINGRRTLLLGCAVHHDNGVLGACAYPFAEERKVRLLKEAGFNTIRSAHNPCSDTFLEACDKFGMLVIDEYVDMWYIHKNRYDYADYFEEWWRRDLADIIPRDYNHPSVVMYSLGNEVSETGQAKGIAIAREMVEFCHALDNTRPVTCGVNIFFNYLSALGFGVYSDKKADKAAKENPGKQAQTAGSAFFNGLAGLFGSSFMKFGATLRGSDVKTRDVFGILDVAGYNYGINRYKRDLAKYPKRLILGSETFSFDAYKFIEIAKDNPRIIGDVVWAGMDYLGEVGLGAWEYKSYAPDFGHGVGWLTSGCGKMDITGKPQAEIAYMRVAYGLDKIRMAVVPADTAKEPHSPSAWRMTNAVESWAWGGCEGKETKAEVYARAAVVKLFINNKLIGEKGVKNDCRFIFPVRFESGELTAVAYDENGVEIARTTLKSAGDDTVLLIEPEQASVELADLCYVRLRYTDQNGVTKPLARGDITLAVLGGRLLGFGNGCPYNERGYVTNVSATYYGEALAVIQPEREGEMEIVAKSRYGETKQRVLITKNKPIKEEFV